MIPAITLEECEAILRSEVDPRWLDLMLSDPDGTAIIYGILDAFVDIDAKDADLAASMRVAPSASQIGPPASGPQYAAVELGVTRRKVGRTLEISEGTLVQSADEQVYALDAAPTFGGGDVNASRDVNATAVRPGYPGILPPGTIDRFVPVAKGVTGLGVALNILPGSGQPRALRISTNATKPHLFRSDYIGMYIEITSGPNAGRQFKIAKVNDGSSLAAPNVTESAFAWTGEFDTTTSAEFANLTTGTIDFEWAVRDWEELGFTVVNTTYPVGGRYGLLDELSRSRGRQRASGEGDELLRARLLRMPERPSPLGVLRGAIVALAVYGATRHDLRIYELGESGPDDVDLYAENFPAGGDFISDLHCTDMSTPDTPEGMYSIDPDYATLVPAFDPGLALVSSSISPFQYLTRWDPPVGMASDVVAEIRVALWNSLKTSRHPGSLFQIYNTEQWGF